MEDGFPWVSCAKVSLELSLALEKAKKQDAGNEAPNAAQVERALLDIQKEAKDEEEKRASKAQDRAEQAELAHAQACQAILT